MKTKVNLTKEDTGTVHVDDVDVSGGVYGKSVIPEDKYIFYVLRFPTDTYGITKPTFRDSDIELHNTSPSLRGLLQKFSKVIFFTMPDNRRIVLEKPLHVDDLKDTDHVGFETETGEKGEIIATSECIFLGVLPNDTEHYRPNKCLGIQRHTSLKDVLVNHGSDHKVIAVWRFSTYKLLKLWLAE